MIGVRSNWTTFQAAFFSNGFSDLTGCECKWCQHKEEINRVTAKCTMFDSAVRFLSTTKVMSKVAFQAGSSQHGKHCRAKHDWKDNHIYNHRKQSSQHSDEDSGTTNRQNDQLQQSVYGVTIHTLAFGKSDFPLFYSLSARAVEKRYRSGCFSSRCHKFEVVNEEIFSRNVSKHVTVWILPYRNFMKGKARSSKQYFKSKLSI